MKSLENLNEIEPQNNANKKENPLLKAITDSNNLLVKKLINSGVKVPYACLPLALTRFDYEFFEYLFNKVELKQEQLKKLFKSALIYGYENKIQLIASHIEGKCPECVNILDGRNPIAYKWLNTPTMLNLLIEKGLDFNSYSKNGESIVHTAVKKRNFEFVLLALNNGVDINILDNDKNSLLVYIIKNCLYSEDISSRINFLIKNNINVNLKNRWGATALIEVINNTTFEKEDVCAKIATQLLDAGADAEICNNDGFNALMLATKLGYKKIKKAIEQKGYDFKTCFLSQPPKIMYETAIYSQDESLFDLLLVDKINKVKYDYFNSALGLAYENISCNEKSVMVVNKLIEMGAKFNKQERHILTPQNAVFKCFEELSIKLINLNLYFIKDEREDDDYYYYPLYFHAVLDNKNELLDCLLKKGSSILSAKSGLWLLSLAIQIANESAIEKLLKKIKFASCLKLLSDKETFEFLPLLENDKPTLYYCDPLLTAIKVNNTKLVATLVKKYTKNSEINLNAYIHAIEKFALLENKNQLLKIFNDILFNPNVAGSNFITACAEGNYKLAHKLLASGVDINTTQNYKTTAVNHIVNLYCKEVKQSKLNNYREMLKWLKEKGADFNITSTIDKGAMFTAVYHNKSELIDYLLSLGCSNKKQIEEIYATLALYKIVSKKECNASVEEVASLIEKGADLNYSGYDILNPSSLLIEAVKNNNFHLLTTLINAGANTELTDSYGYNFFDNIFTLSNYKHQEVFSLILPYANKFKPSAIISFVSKNRINSVDETILQSLINAGIDINAINEKGDSALYNACVCCNNEYVKILLENGANVNTIHNDYEHKIFDKYTTKTIKEHTTLTPLMAAILQGNFNTSTIKYLIEYGADVNATNNNNDNALTLLLDEKCNPCIQCLATEFKQQISKPSIYSYYTGCFEIIKMLINAGLDLDHKNNNGHSARELIKKSKNEKFINLLK